MKNVSLFLLTIMVLVFGIPGMSDGQTLPPNLSIYWAHWNQIQYWDGSNRRNLITDRTLPDAVALDVIGGKMYWSAIPAFDGPTVIRRSNLDGSNVTDFITELGEVRSIALDAPRGKIYWSTQTTWDPVTRERGHGGKIQCANLDGSNITDLVSVDLGYMLGLNLDIAGGKMYWTNERNRIQRANLDGSNVQEIVDMGNTSGDFIQDIALDVSGNQVYFTTVNSRTNIGNIWSANLDGSNVVNRITNLRKPSSIAIDTAGAKMYWTGVHPLGTREGAGDGKIGCANLDGSNVRDLLTGLDAPDSIALGVRLQTVAPTPQPQVVVIPDPNLRAAVQEQIGNTLTTDTMLNLTRLNASGRGIRDLTGLEHATNLTELLLHNNAISDVSPLSGLTQLDHLFLYNNSISDISPLSRMTQLLFLTLNHNSISDISPLSRMTQLSILHLQYNNISNISPLSGLTQLTSLNLYQNPLNAAAINTHIPAIQARGAEVLFDNRATTPQQQVVNTPQPPVAPTPQTPDLTVSNFRVSKTTLAPGEQFTLFATIENRGTQQSAATPVQFQRTTDDFYTQIGIRNVPALGANRSVKVDFPTTAPVQAGAYHYRAYIQIANQHSTSSTITVAAPVTAPVVPTPQPNVGTRATTPNVGTTQVPDLVVSDFRASKTALALGEPYTLFGTIKNQGTGTAATATLTYYITTTYYQTPDNVNWPDAAKIAITNPGPLEPNGSIEVNVPFNNRRRAGTYYFYACIDGVSNERNRNNNCSTAVRVTIGSPATTPVVPTPQPPVVNTPQRNVVNTPNTTVELIPDPNLRASIQQEIGNTVTTDTIVNLTFLDAFGLGIRDLTGLEHAYNLRQLYLWDNNISDISPLNRLTRLTDLDLHDNNISDISPLNRLTRLTDLDLHDNNISDISPLARLTRLTDLDITENPLNAAAINTHIPALQARGTDVEFDDHRPTTPPDEDGMAVDNSQVNTRTPTLPIDPAQSAIYWSTWADEIRRANLDGSNPKTLVKGMSVISELTFDVAGGKMYWTHGTGSEYHEIQRANLDGSNVETFLRTAPRHQRRDLTLNVSDGKMYWTSYQYDENSNPLVVEIQRANLDGSNIETLVTEGKPSGPILDVGGGKMYWTDWDLGKIQRANLDGSNIETLVTEGEPTSLTLDAFGKKMYWRDRIGIQCANFDGSNIETLVKGVFPSELILDVGGGKMYWTINISDSNGFRKSRIQCANLDGSNIKTLVTEDFIHEFTLDVGGGKMYWESYHNRQRYRIHRANLDGSNIEVIVTGTGVQTFTLIPSQTTRVPPTKTVHVHVDATDRPPMYWIDTQAGTYAATLHRLVDAEVEHLLPSVQNVTSLTLDVANDTLYWTEQTSNTTGKIRSANMDGTNVQLVKNLTSLPLDITFNPADSKLYLTNAWGKVQRLNVDGSGFQPNLITDLETPMNLVVDVVNEKLYWTEQTSNKSGKIGSANLDGTNVQLVKNLTSVPLDIAVDATDGKLYLTNAWGKVQRMNVDGSGFQPNFITGVGIGLGIAVDPTAQQLYLTIADGIDGKIIRRNFSGGGVEDVVTGLGRPGRLVLNNSQPVLDNRAPGTAGAQRIVENLKLTAAQMAHIGEQITFNLNIAGGETVGGYQVTVQFDETALRYISSANGDYLPDGAFFVPPTADGDRVTLGAQAVTGEGNGDGTLATLTFEIIAVKASTLMLSEVTLANSAGEGNVNFNDLQLVLDNRDRSPYDVNGDGTVDDADASLLTEAISNGSTDAKYDVNNDGNVNFDDLQLVLDNRDRSPYDVNGDGTVDDADASLLTEAISNGSTDAKYDVNNDGNVNFDDLQLVLDNRAPGAAGAPSIGQNLKLTAAQLERLQAQIELLIATGDRSPTAMRTLIYLQQFIALARPEKTQLLANYPNPFNPETWIPYELATDTTVKITIYNTQGVVIRTLVLGHQSAGYYTGRDRAAYWDGRNALGEQVASGIYFYHFETDEMSSMRKMVILK